MGQHVLLRMFYITGAKSSIFVQFAYLIAFACM